MPRDFQIPEKICALDSDTIIFENICSLCYKHLDLVLQGDDDIGYTTTVKHRIQLTDEQPVSQPNRCISTSQYD